MDNWFFMRSSRRSRAYLLIAQMKGLEILYAHLEGVAGGGQRTGSEARIILVSKGLYDRGYEPGREETGGIVLGGVALVEEFGRIGESILSISKRKLEGWADVAGHWLAQQIKGLADTEAGDLVCSFMAPPFKDAIES